MCHLWRFFLYPAACDWLASRLQTLKPQKTKRASLRWRPKKEAEVVQMKAPSVCRQVITLSPIAHCSVITVAFPEPHKPITVPVRFSPGERRDDLLAGLVWNLQFYFPTVKENQCCLSFLILCLGVGWDCPLYFTPEKFILSALLLDTLIVYPSVRKIRLGESHKSCNFCTWLGCAFLYWFSGCMDLKTIPLS